MSFPNPEKLQILANASQALHKYMWQPERIELLEEVTKHAADLLDAENAAILLPQHKHVRLVASYPPIADSTSQRDFPITSSSKCGMTSFLATLRKPLRLNTQQLETHACNRRTPPRHLPTGRGFSLIGIPIADERGQLLALLKAENKKNASNIPDADTHFTQSDEYIAQILASQLKVVVEATQIAETLAALSLELHNSATERQFFERLLEQVKDSLGCERTDYFVNDPSQSRLIWKGRVGPFTGDNPLPCPAPIDSVVAALIESGLDSVGIPDVSKEKRYWHAWNETKSQGAVLVRDHNRIIGVISAESSTLKWFDKDALERMKTIARVCAPLIHTHSTETAVSELYSGHPTRDTLVQHLWKAASATHRIVGIESQAVVAIYEQGKSRSYTVLSMTVRGKPSAPCLIESAKFLDQFAENPVQRIASVQDFSDSEVRTMVLEGTILAVPLEVTYGKATQIASSSRNPKSVFVLLCWPLLPEVFAAPTANPVPRIKPFAEVIAHQIDVAFESNAESELHRRYHEALNMLPQRVFQKDEAGVFVAVNKSLAVELCVKSPEDVEGKTDFAFFPAATAEKYRADDLRVMKGRVTLSWYETFRPITANKHDHGKVILVIKSPILGPPNPYWPREDTRRVVGVIGIFWEVSESMMFIKCAEDGRVMWLNEFAKGVLGTREDSLNVFDLLDSANSAKLRKILSSTPGISPIRSDRLIAIELPRAVTIGDGESRIRILELTEVVRERLEDGASGVDGYRILAADVTVSEQRDERIKMRNWRAVLPGLLALGIAHGLRHLIGSVQIQERNLRKQIKAQDHLIPNSVISAIERMMETFSRIKRPVDELMTLRETQDDLDQLRLLEKQSNVVVNLIRRAQEVIDSDELLLDLSGVPEELCINVHGTLVAEVFHNLLNNAIKHAPGKSVIVSAALSNRSARIIFRDFGGGIPDDVLPEIFEPFFTTKLNDGGNGIGLAFARAVIEDIHSGRIRAKNHPGGGAVFEIELPEGSNHSTNEQN